MRSLSQRLVEHAAQVIAPLRPTQAQAMTAELTHISKPSAALSFALGCVGAAYRQRLGIVAALSFSARLSTALAASGFGLIHIFLPWSNLDLKMKLMSDPGFTACGASCAGWVHTVNGLSVSYLLWQQTAMAGLGILHLFAAVIFFRGDMRRLIAASLQIAVLALVLPLTHSGGITFPAAYVVLITMLVAMGFALAKLQQWDFARRRIT